MSRADTPAGKHGGSNPKSTSGSRTDTPAGAPGGTLSTGMKPPRDNAPGAIFPGCGKPTIKALHLAPSSASAMKRTVD